MKDGKIFVKTDDLKVSDPEKYKNYFAKEADRNKRVRSQLTKEKKDSKGKNLSYGFKSNVKEEQKKGKLKFEHSFRKISKT